MGSVAGSVIQATGRTDFEDGPRIGNQSEVGKSLQRVRTVPDNNHGILIVLRYSADPLKAVSNLRLVPYPRAILKIRPPSSLDYRARHRLQTEKHPLCSHLFNLLKNLNFPPKLFLKKMYSLNGSKIVWGPWRAL